MVATAPMKNVGLYVNKLLKLVKHVNELSAKCRELGIEPIDLAAFKRRVAERLEDLPIHEESCLDSNLPIMYFILAGGEWWPVRHGQETEACGSKHWLLYRIDYTDGVCESGPCKPYYWAHCTMDDGVNYHWFDEDFQDEDLVL